MTTALYDIPRHAVAAGLAALVTSGLFLIMYQLIATDPPPLEDQPRLRFDAVMVRPEKPVIERTRPPEPVPDPAPAPEFTPEIARVTPETAGPGMGNPAPPIDGPDIGSKLGSSGIVAIFRVQPEYPLRAISRGIEGYVDLVFDVTAAGATENIRVLAAEPQGFFEKAAIRALKKWKFKPPMEDEQPYRQDNMTTRITFALES